MSDFLTPPVRKWAYIVFALLGVVFGATQTAFTTAEVPAPLWLTVAFQVYLYVGGAFGLIAATNTTATKTAQRTGALANPVTIGNYPSDAQVDDLMGFEEPAARHRR